MLIAATSTALHAIMLNLAATGFVVFLVRILVGGLGTCSTGFSQRGLLEFCWSKNSLNQRFGAGKGTNLA